ncbi:MAG: NADPH:quinone oxidoreductase family protein [Actinomycetota bacterium]|nr:NADPH:quinone oxidoreductase family protein [Actinomycetota bacterium]
MQAWQVHENGPPEDVLVWADDLAPLRPGEGEVVIDVRAAAVNFADDLVCRGTYQEKPALPFTPGMEVSGVVAAVGTGVELAVGRRVLAAPQLAHGGYATHALARASDTFEIPDELDDVAAAALFVTYQTGWCALAHRARLEPGETLLVHAGAGGVGSAAIQLAKAIGARVVATAGGADKTDVCRRLGADEVVDYRSEDFVEVVNDLTDGRGADVVFDPVGGDTFDRSTKCIAWGGRILIVGFAGGRIAEARTNHVLVKNYGVLGVHWGGYRSRAPELVRTWHDDLMRLAAGGAIAPLVSQVVPLSDAPKALAAVTSRGTVGKVVLDPAR